MDFGEGKGKVNILASSQIELEPLAGGYRRGDRVMSLIEHEPNSLAKGDTGGLWWSHPRTLVWLARQDG